MYKTFTFHLMHALKEWPEYAETYSEEMEFIKAIRVEDYLALE